MKILAFSDVHGSARAARALVEASDGVDLVIGAGDFCNMRQGLDEAMALFQGLKAPFVIVPGNAESADELRAAAGAGTTVLHGDGCEIGGLSLFGLGYAVPPTPFGAWSCDLSEAQAETALAACAAADILILHSPPKGIADRTSAGQSVGSTAIRDAIARIRPRLAVCGHIHDSWGETGQIGTSRILNLGPAGHVFEMDP
ncbi:phosphodiesterase, family [Marinibacterium anthonyi]|nr:phosphodiesterase, family [Marinibacterium anthonyi]